MPTSVHIPKPLLVAVDRKARTLKISRNRLIVQALEREVAHDSNWSPDFFERLESPEAGVQGAAGDNGVIFLYPSIRSASTAGCVSTVGSLFTDESPVVEQSNFQNSF